MPDLPHLTVRNARGEWDPISHGGDPVEIAKLAAPVAGDLPSRVARLCAALEADPEAAVRAMEEARIARWGAVDRFEWNLTHPAADVLGSVHCASGGWRYWLPGGRYAAGPTRDDAFGIVEAHARRKGYAVGGRPE